MFNFFKIIMVYILFVLRLNLRLTQNHQFSSVSAFQRHSLLSFQSGPVKMACQKIVKAGIPELNKAVQAYKPGDSKNQVHMGFLAHFVTELNAAHARKIEIKLDNQNTFFNISIACSVFPTSPSSYIY